MLKIFSFISLWSYYEYILRYNYKISLYFGIFYYYISLHMILLSSGLKNNSETVLLNILRFLINFKNSFNSWIHSYKKYFWFSSSLNLIIFSKCKGITYTPGYELTKYLLNNLKSLYHHYIVYILSLFNSTCISYIIYELIYPFIYSYLVIWTFYIQLHLIFYTVLKDYLNSD